MPAATGKGELLVEAWTSYAGWTPFYRMDLDKRFGDYFSLTHRKSKAAYRGASRWRAVFSSIPICLPGKYACQSFAPWWRISSEKTRKKLRGPGGSRNDDGTACLQIGISPEAPAPVIIETMTDMNSPCPGTSRRDNTWADFGLGEFQ